MAKSKPNLKKLKEDFDTLLKDVWRVWEEGKPEDEEDEEEWSKGPFETREWTWQSTMDEQERENLREDLGWLLGVAAVTGWRLDRPGPREWSPR